MVNASSWDALRCVLFLYAVLVLGAVVYLLIFAAPVRPINAIFAATLSGRLYMRHNKAFFDARSYLENKKSLLRSLDDIPAGKRYSMVTHDIFRIHLQRAEKQGRLMIFRCKRLKRNLNLSVLERWMGKDGGFTGKVAAYRIDFMMLK